MTIRWEVCRVSTRQQQLELQLDESHAVISYAFHTLRKWMQWTEEEHNCNHGIINLDRLNS